MKEKHNSDIFLRPRFEVDLKTSKEQVLSSFRKKLKIDKPAFPSKIIDDHLFIDIPKKDNHFWSPQLHLEIIENEKGCKLKGLFGPKPQVWTMFMFVHFIVGTSFLGFCVWAYSNASLGKEYIVPIIFIIVLPIIWFVLYFVGRLGRDVGKKQMKKLQDFTLEILNSI